MPVIAKSGDKKARMTSLESKDRISDPKGWLDNYGVIIALRFFACCRTGIRTAAVFHRGRAPAPELASVL